MGESVSADQQFPTGWYPDPETPGRDRWWDGQATTRYTARTVDPAKANFGVGFVHAMRIGANRILIVARVLLVVDFLLLMFLLLSIRSVTSGGWMTAYSALTAVSVVASLATLAIGIIGLRRSARLGAKGVAIWAIATGGAFTLLMLVPVLFVLFSRP